jgi:hypothetical protein
MVFGVSTASVVEALEAVPLDGDDGQCMAHVPSGGCVRVL